MKRLTWPLAPTQWVNEVRFSKAPLVDAMVHVFVKHKDEFGPHWTMETSLDDVKTKEEAYELGRLNAIFDAMVILALTPETDEEAAIMNENADVSVAEWESEVSTKQ